MAAARKPFSIDIAKPLSEADRERLKKEEPKKQSREEWRKQKELEEARKLGNAPAEVDEEGKDINPHIPQYISTVPWYVDPTQRASLKHQRAQPEKQQEYSNLNEWYHRGVPSQPIPSKFRKGACTNCGSMTHKKKDCLERPRKVGAKFTGQGIAPDDFAQPELSLDFDGKRDRWNGYDPNRHQEVVDDYAKIEVAKHAVKGLKLQEELLSGKMSDAVKDDDEVEDEDKYADKIDMPGTNFDSKRRITVRNLRIREDIAKYLRNLDPNSAYYDPKTRSMRENPYEETGKTVNEVDYAGDNFVRYTGDTHDMAKMQMFAWEAGDKGVEVHLQADPTRLEMLQKSFDVRKDDFKKNQRDSILSKYGGLEHLDAPARELLLAQTEDYVEYSRQGSVIKGQEKARTKSKYVEDLYINNHTSVWGSYWKKGIWGFACCHSTIKQSYCTGETGKGIQNSDAVSMPKPFTKKDERLQKLEEKNTAWEKALGISGRCVEVEPPEDVEEVRDDEDVEEETQQKSLLQQHREKLESDQKKEKKRKKKKEKKRKRKRKHKRKVETSSSSSSDESEVDSDEPREKRERKRMLKEVEREKVEKERKLQEALKKERDHAAKMKRLMKMDERKRPYNSASKEATVEPTAEEMEAYMMRKKNEDDPMNFFT